MNTYIEENNKKLSYLKNLFKKDFDITTLYTMDDPLNYRHKVCATFFINKNKEIDLGFYEENSHYLNTKEFSNIENIEAQNIITDLKKYFARSKYSVYTDKNKHGLLRHVVIRVSKANKKIMLIFIINGDILPGSKNIIKHITNLYPNITSVCLNINKRDTSMILSDTNRILYGPGYILDYLDNMSFKISPSSFFQVNPLMAEKLYKLALEKAKLNSNDHVLDAYSGTGTIGILASKSSKWVTSVESNRSAYKDAIENSRYNKIKNITFINDDATRFILNSNHEFDVVILDPPRSGSSKEFLNAIIQNKTKRIVYISCNPESLKRDLSILKKSYNIKDIFGVDMFPFTSHVECVALLSRFKKY